MKISVRMITMNEEQNIERALSACDLADEYRGEETNLTA